MPPPWFQFPAVFHIQNSTVWETLLVHSLLKQLQIWKTEWASNFISFHVFRCPLKLCRTSSERMGRGKGMATNCDIQPKINSLIFQLCRGHHYCKTKNNKFGSSCSCLSQNVAWQPCKMGEGSCGSQHRKKGRSGTSLDAEETKEEPHYYRW